MAPGARIQGNVVMDVTADTAGLREDVDKKLAKAFGLNVDVNLPTKANLQAQLDRRVGKGLKLFIDELNMPGKAEMQAQLDSKAGKGLKLKIEKLDLPGKAAMQADLTAKVGKGLKLRVDIDVTDSSFLPVIAKMEAAQKAITAIEAKELLKRETARVNSQTRSVESLLKNESKLATERLILEDRTNARLEVLNDQHFNRLNAQESAAALRREVIETNLQARLTAADDAFAKRRQFAAESAERKIQLQANKPILQTVLINASKLNSSLADFDRTMSRGLRTSLLAFTAWSAGVEAAVGAAAIAGIASFAKLEIAATRASTVVASQKFADEVQKQGHAVTSFAANTEAAQKKIIAVSQKVALATIGFNPTQVTEGVQSLLQAGEKLPEALKNIGPAAKFAQVNQADLKTTTDGLAAALAAAGLQSKDSALLLDKFSFTAQTSLGDAGDFLDAFTNRAGASFKAYGRGVNETLTLLHLLGNTGVLGKEAGTQAFIVLRDIAKAAGKAPEAFQKYSIAIRDADHRTTPFSKTLVDLAKVFQRVQKAQGDVGVFRLGQELGLTQKSIGSLLQVIPQVAKEGQKGLDDFSRGLDKTGGNIQRQVTQQRKTIAAQFDNLKDTFSVAFAVFGSAASSQVTKFFDEFAGTGGLISRATPQLEKFGHSFGILVGRLANFVSGPSFIAGIKSLVDAIQITLAGVSDALAKFGGAFDSSGKGVSTFEAFANAVRAFATLSATVLPIVAETIGKIVNFLIDHRDAFEGFAKLAIGVFVVRKAWLLFVAPVGAAITALIDARKALIAFGAAETIGPVKSALVMVATRLGIIEAAADSATAAMTRLSAAELLNLRASSVGGVAGASEGAIASRFRALAPLKSGQIEQSTRRTLTSGTGELSSATATSAFASSRAKSTEEFAASLNKSNPIVEASAARFGKIGEVFAKLIPDFVKALPLIGGIAEGFAKVAGPIGIVIALVQGVIGVFQGFFEEVKRGSANGDVANSFRELKPIIDGVGKALKVTFQIVLDILGVVGAVGKSIGRALGFVFNEMVVGFGDSLRGIKLLFQGDFIGALKAFGDVIVNSITSPFRLAIGLVIDLLADVVGAFKHIPGIGGKVRELEDGMRGAAASVRDFRLNMSAAKDTSDSTKRSTDELSSSSRQAALSVGEIALQHRIVSNLASLSATAMQRSADQARGSVVLLTNQTRVTLASQGNLLASLNTFHPVFSSVGADGVNAMGRIASAAQNTTGQLLAMQAALQAGIGQSKNAENSLIDAGLQQALTNAQAGVGALSPAQVQAQIRGQRELERRQRLISAARRARGDQKIISDALGTTGGPLPSAPKAKGSTGAAPAPVHIDFVDPDEAIRTQIDKLKPQIKIAATQQAIGRALKAGESGYAATRREVLLFQDALPGLQKELDKQKAAVDALDNSLTTLRNTQLLGTKAFTDQTFALDQQSKALQLQKVDLQIGGAADGDPRLAALDKQIAALQLQSEHVSLTESLQLDPLRKKLDETFNPTTEASFANIIKQFKDLSAQRQAANDKLTQQTTIQSLVSAAAETGAAKFDKLDAAASKAVDAMNAAAEKAAKTAKAVGGTGDAAGAAAGQVDKYSGAVANVPSGKNVVDKSLKGINQRVAALAPQFTGAGAAVLTHFTQGVNGGVSGVLLPALGRAVGDVLAYLRSPISPATDAGAAVMGGFLTGLKQGFGTPDVVGSVAWYLNVFIPDWIRKNKGPVAYDATILVPAGHAVMEGFGKGLRDGFSQVAHFVKEVGPSLSESISTDLFSGRVGTIMADIAVGKAPDIEGILGDLRVGVVPGLTGFTGPIDARLGFLHQTESLADTTQMAQQLAQLFGLIITATTNGKHAVGSQHYVGQAADLSNSSGGGDNPASNTPQMLALAQALAPFQGSIVKQLIYQNRDWRTGATITGHQNHDHVGFQPAPDFSEFSGKIGKAAKLPSIPLFQGPQAMFQVPGESKLVAQALARAAGAVGIDLRLLTALTKAESGFNPKAGSPAGAFGLTQLLAGTAHSLGVNNIFDPFENALGGAKYLKQQIDRFHSIPLALAAYNAGPGAVEHYKGIPPFAETQAYVKRIEEFIKSFGGARELGGPTRAGKTYLVGERGPELHTPAAGGMVIPADQTARILSGGGSGVTYEDKSVTHIHSGVSDPEVLADLIKARKKRDFTAVNFR